MNIQDIIIQDVIRAASFAALYFFIFMLAKWFKGFFIPYKLDHELTKSDNVAVALMMSGYYLGTAIIFFGALLGPSRGLLGDLISVGAYSILGLILLNLSRWFNEKMILRKFNTTEQLITEKNFGVGVVQFGIYVATSLIAAGAISGQGGGVLTCVVFFILGQICLFLFSCLYAKTSLYNVHEELKNKNMACGVAFSGHLIALAIIVMNAVSGDFIDWKKDLLSFSLAATTAFIFLPILRLIMDKLVVPGDSLAREIREDKNIGAGLLEAVTAISFALILTILI